MSHTGTIKKLMPRLSAGLIAFQDAKEPVYFSVLTNLAGYKFQDLQVGQKVLFKFKETARGPLATELVVADSPLKVEPVRTISV